MATYNGEKYIEEQITSILSQLDNDDELIISDDHSNDNTLNIIKEIKDKRIRFFINEKNMGVIRNFENAIYMANGDYIFLSDQDDVWLPNKIRDSIIKIEHLEKNNPNLPILVFSDAIIVDESLNILVESLFKYTGQDPKLSVRPEILCVANRILGCTMAFNKKTKEIILPIGDYAVMHDWWIALNVAKNGIIEPIFTQTILYRQHKDNIIGANFLKKKNKLFRLKSLCIFNIKIYKMCSSFFPMSSIRYLFLKLRLHF